MGLLEPLFKGLVYGLFLVLSLGPIFFFLIETSIERGFFSAFFVALGTLLSDALYIVITYFSIASWFNNDHVKYWMGLVGGIVLIIFGVYNFIKHGGRSSKEIHLELKKTRYWVLFVKAFTINTLNPFAPLFWIASSAYVTAQSEYTRVSYFMFFIGTLVTVFGTDLLKAFGAHSIKNYVSHHNMRWMNYAAGVIMIIFGIDLLWQVFHGGIKLPSGGH